VSEQTSEVTRPAATAFNKLAVETEAITVGGTQGVVGAEIGFSIRPPSIAISSEPNILYPRAFDQGVSLGQARGLISSAARDCMHAIDDFSEANLDGVASYFGLIASSVAAARNILLSEPGSDALIGLLSFTRRAVLSASIDNIDLRRLNALAKALKAVEKNPVITFDDAARAIDELTTFGFNGANAEIQRLIAAVMSVEADELEVLPSTSEA
jgi:hypothetical protein